MRIYRWGTGLLALGAASLWLCGVAGADVSTEQSGSILVFPKVIANGTRDTIIQISNTSNSLVRAHCFYVNGALRDPSQPPGALNPPLWQEIDFDIVLTKQQPTHWVVSQGRRVDPFDQICGSGPPWCDGAGFDPGLIPPVVPDFTGELKCIEVDDSGAPLSGNHLKGEATLIQASGSDLEFNVLSSDLGLKLVVAIRIAPLGTGSSAVEASKYNAIAILGNENNGDGKLVLGAGQCAGDGLQHGAVCGADADCGDSAPCALEYNACPQTWILDHAAEGAPDIVAGVSPASASVDTELTVVPCTENFETQQPTSVTLQFVTTNEFESQFSVSTTITCWANFRLADVGATALTFEGQPLADPLGTMFLQTRIRPAQGATSGVLMVAEEFHVITAPMPVGGDTSGADLYDKNVVFGSDAVNVHMEGARSEPDVMSIPNDQLLP